MDPRERAKCPGDESNAEISLIDPDRHVQRSVRVPDNPRLQQRRAIRLLIDGVQFSP